MNRHSPQTPNEELRRRIRQHLQRPDAQQRIQTYVQNARSNASVTTSRAAELLDLGQQQLRDWNKRGLIRTERPTLLSPQDGKSSPGLGHRQFTLDELDKLAVIKELTSKGGMSPGDLLPFIDDSDIWQEGLGAKDQAQMETDEHEARSFMQVAIDERIRKAQEKHFWRFFALHALRFSLMLIREEREDKPTGTIGLVLPLHRSSLVRIQHIDDLSRLGMSMVGWLNQHRFSHIMLTYSPSFEVPSDYRIHPLAITKENQQQEGQQDNTHIIVRRDAAPLTLSAEVVETVRALLQPMYEDVEKTESCFGFDMYDMIDSIPSRDDTAPYPHLILNGLANMTIRLGGKKNNSDYWRFSCILLPSDSHLPFHQRSLIVRAQSENSPYKIGVSSVPPDLDSLSVHAYQNSLLSYRNTFTPNEVAIAYRTVQENEIKSAIAVPIGGEEGEPLGAMYIASEYEGAFSKVQDRRKLRILSRMVGELVRTYEFRWQETESLDSILHDPDIVDQFLGKLFPSENDFINDLEGFLRELATYHSTRIQREAVPTNISFVEETHEDESEVQSEIQVITLLGIDVDHVTLLALKYGDQAVRNLYREIGGRIKGELASTFKKYPGCQFYHILADRFYVLLKYIPYDQALKKAWVLKKSLDDPYKISLVHPIGPLSPAAGTLEELTITVRIAVSSYTEEALDELFKRYSEETGIVSLRETIERALASQLKKGMASGGNIIRAFDPISRTFQQLKEEG
ncbi:MAG: MerR family transcriptional regulator [Ktedonobacteraceae bacterium]